MGAYFTQITVYTEFQDNVATATQLARLGYRIRHNTVCPVKDLFSPHVKRDADIPVVLVDEALLAWRKGRQGARSMNDIYKKGIHY